MDIVIFLGEHTITDDSSMGDIQKIHTTMPKIPRKGDLITTTVSGKTVSAKIQDVEWIVDRDKVNIFL